MYWARRTSPSQGVGQKAAPGRRLRRKRRPWLRKESSLERSSNRWPPPRLYPSRLNQKRHCRLGQTIMMLSYFRTSHSPTQVQNHPQLLSPLLHETGGIGIQSRLWVAYLTTWRSCSTDCLIDRGFRTSIVFTTIVYRTISIRVFHTEEAQLTACLVAWDCVYTMSIFA